MKKSSRKFICQSCGEIFPRWAGKCEACGTWNSIQEEVSGTEKFSEKKRILAKDYSSPKELSDFTEDGNSRSTSGFSELDIVLGGGIVKGGLYLIGGEPGVGKSTLVLSIAGKLSGKSKILYISGEESSAQIKLRADRLKLSGKNLFLSSETCTEKICAMLEGESPDLVFVDSIQTVARENTASQAGSVTQLRESAQLFLETCKRLGIPIFLIGHITKEGSIAGPKVLEHLVDVVLYFESDKWKYYRILRAVKNRFGPVGDVAVFEMHTEGLKEISDKNHLFITKEQSERTGSVISAVLEGSRAIGIEVQALVSTGKFSHGRRMAEGMDNGRLILLSAVVEKFLSIEIGNNDIFANLAGGLKADDPGLDLAVCGAITSSFLGKKFPAYTALLGEVGLSGEVRTVSNLSGRLRELASIGMQRVYVPSGSVQETDSELKNKIEIIETGSIEILRELFH